MFNLFKKKKEQHPIADVFHDLTNNQKMSVLNLLLTIGICDGEQGNQQKELQYLNTYSRIFQIRSEACMNYLSSFGHDRIISDLKNLSLSQKEFLAVASWEMINCDGRANDIEIEVAGNLFEKMGFSEKQFVDTIQKSQMLMKRFMGK